MNAGKDFVNRIDLLLKQKKEKRQTLADFAGISVQAFTNWSIRGNFPPSDIAVKIAEYLNTTVEYLVTGKNPENAEKIAAVKEQLLQAIQQLDELH